LTVVANKRPIRVAGGDDRAAERRKPALTLCA
jgi:hypothetical protein